MNSQFLKVLAVCAVGTLICGWIIVTGPEPLKASIVQGKPVVTVGPLQRTKMPYKVTAYGTLNPRQVLELKTQVSGEIVWTHEDLVPGGMLAKDTVLFKVDERDYSIALDTAEARYAEAQADVEIEQGRYEIAQLEWSAWQENQNRSKTPSPLALREPQKAKAEAKRRGISAQMRRAKLVLERTVVRAPWSASVVSANVALGQVLVAGAPVGTLYPLDYGVVDLQMPIKTLRLMDLGVEEVTLRSVGDPTSEAVIGVFERSVNALTNDTRLATVRVRVDHPLESHGWVFGMPLQATLVARNERAVVLIPPDLIVSGNFLWIYRDGRAVRHQVQPLEQRGTKVTVLDNFGPADVIILQRPIGLFDGAIADVIRS